MKKISRDEAEACICQGKQVYMLTPITTMTTVVEYLSAKEFCVEEVEETPRKPPILLDYDQIMKMREDGMTYDAIGEKMHCSGQTIINFLKREGKRRRENNT